MTKPRILAFAGSARKDSYNARLVRIAAEGARQAGAEVSVLELKDYPLRWHRYQGHLNLLF